MSSDRFVLTRPQYLQFKRALAYEKYSNAYWKWAFGLLLRKFDPNQPRIPAGQPGGGRWTDGDGDGGPERETPGQTEARSPRDVTLPDGTRVQTLYDATRFDSSWDSRHIVTTPDGRRTEFENEGRIQTVRDLDSGGVVSRTIWTPDGPVEMPVAGQVGWQRGVTSVVRAAQALYSALSSQPHAGTAVFDMRARGYGSDGETVTWTGTLSEAEVGLVCDREGVIQGAANRAYQQALGEVGSGDTAALGSRTHMLLAQSIKARGDPNLRAEVSRIGMSGEQAHYGEQGSLRADILHNVGNGVVCIPDLKVGLRPLSTLRMNQLAPIAAREFPGTRRIVVYEMRPREP